jgi:hypothetical protein
MVLFFLFVVKNLWNTGGTIDRIAAAESFTSTVGVSLESIKEGEKYKQNMHFFIIPIYAFCVMKGVEINIRIC